MIAVLDALPDGRGYVHDTLVGLQSVWRTMRIWGEF
jgi:hypothetical protein